MDYYKQYMVNYLSMDDAMRQSEKLHYTRCHLNNIASGRQDLIIFSAKILKAIESADEEIANACGVSVDEVKLYAFSRWARMPVYEVV